jgi:hypothetical protein
MQDLDKAIATVRSGLPPSGEEQPALRRQQQADDQRESRVAGERTNRVRLRKRFLLIE